MLQPRQIAILSTASSAGNHAAELPALRAIEGGELVRGDPYTIPQPGYCHEWDCHGGGAWLKQHLVHDYVACWQQALSDGEWDAAVCDIGTSRWFNYYVNGLHQSTSQPPHMDGIYYDGINFDRASMIRVRKVLNAGAAAAGRAAPLVDIHTGDNGPTAPAATRYLSHFAFADSAWNGEGFDWSRGPAYYLIDASAFLHGIAADRLGGGGHDFQALLFAMYTRNAANAPALWSFWRAVDIGALEMHGWWADAAPVALRLLGDAAAAHPRDAASDGLTPPGGGCSTNARSAADPEGKTTAVLATTHVGVGRLAVVVIGSWCTARTSVALDVDWGALGLDATTSVIRTPSIPGWQPAAPQVPGTHEHAFPIAAGQGVILTIGPA